MRHTALQWRALIVVECGTSGMRCERGSARVGIRVSGYGRKVRREWDSRLQKMIAMRRCHSPIACLEMIGAMRYRQNTIVELDKEPGQT